MKAKVRCAVLISGRGTNLGALISACRDPDFPAAIVLVISNVQGAEGLSRAAAANVATRVISHRDYDTREAFDDAIDSALHEYDVSLVCEAGFMRIHSDKFVRRWEGRLINIHPSLLPAFKGTKVHQQVLAAGVRISGCTVHFVVPELDSGPIIAQSSVPVLVDDTVGTLSARVLAAEHQLYPEALRLVAEGHVRLEGGKAVFA